MTIYYIRKPAQLEALESSIRLEILDVVAADGACSVADLALELGRTPESLYFHVKKLLAVGLLGEDGQREFERGAETLFSAPSRWMALGTKPLTKPRRQALVRISRACARVAQRDLEQNMLGPDWIEVGPERNAHWSKTRGWLTPEELVELNGLIGQVEELMTESRRRPGTCPFAVNLSLAQAKVGQSPRTKVPT